jgi:hypothetical protein
MCSWAKERGEGCDEVTLPLMVAWVRSIPSGSLFTPDVTLLMIDSIACLSTASRGDFLAEVSRSRGLDVDVPDKENRDNIDHLLDQGRRSTPASGILSPSHHRIGLGLGIGILVACSP